MIPAFSRAIAASVEPSKRLWSCEIVVKTASAGCMALVASSRPPSPTSSTTILAWDVAKWSKPNAVMISKKVASRSWNCGSQASSLATTGRTTSIKAIRRSLDTSRPSTLSRSSSRFRCGEVNRPVDRPEAVSAAASITEVEPFPLVPVTWTIVKSSWGSPKARRMRLVRPIRRSAEVLGIPNRS